MSTPRNLRLSGASNRLSAFVLLIGVALCLKVTAQQSCFQSQLWSNYFVCQHTFGAQDSRYPRINNNGQFVYQRQVGGQWQIFGSGNLGQLTFPDGTYTDATSPAIADDGSYVCFRNRTDGIHGWVLRYPGPVIVQSSTGNPAGAHRDAGEHPSMAGGGNTIWWYEFFDQFGGGTRRLFVSCVGQVEGDNWQGDYPDVNDRCDYVYEQSGQIYLAGRGAIANGRSPHIGDAPADNPDIVYVSGTELRSTVMGVIGPGSWVDVNRSGVIVFEYRTNNVTQIFKGYPLPRIVSKGGTNAVVGLRYKYDSDNKAEAYGYSANDDPIGSGPIQWSVLPSPGTPSEFRIDAASGEVAWEPTLPGTNRITIAAENFFGISTQLLTIIVSKPAVEFVDAMPFRPQGSPDLYTDPNQYFSGGQSRVGVVADGASRLVIRVSLEGFNPSDPNLNLRFAIENATSNNGSLSRISSMSWAEEVPVEFATDGVAHKAVCIYESPRDYGSASKQVVVQLLDGDQLLAKKEIEIKRPPVVLIHGTFSSPRIWPPLAGLLSAQGYEVSYVDYEISNGSHFSENVPRVFEATTRVIAAVRSSGYAASQVDIVAHSMGGVLARLHTQSKSIQPYNYGRGDVHKLITLGATHWGSYLAGVRTSVRGCNSTAYATIRESVKRITSLLNRVTPSVPYVDLDGGAAEDQTPGSEALQDLKTISAPSHAVVTTWASASGDTVFHLLLHLFKAEPIGDGVVSIESAKGGISPSAQTILPGIFHIRQAGDPGIVNKVGELLAAPLGSGNSPSFGTFGPSSVSSTDEEAIRLASRFWCGEPSLARAASPPAFGNWLLLNGVTNGQQVVPGQAITVSATAGDSRQLRSVMFVSPAGVHFVTNVPFQHSFTIPQEAIGGLGILAVGTDSNGGTSLASTDFTTMVSAQLQNIEITLPPMPLATASPQVLRVFGHFGDGQKRDITPAFIGTKYGYGSSDRIPVRVDTNGVLRAVLNTVAPITIWITNGTVWTNIQVTVDLLNLPPTAVIAASKTNGPAPLDIQFDGTQSRDAELFPITYHWDFGDGTASDMAAPPSHRFLVPGQHTITLTVTDSQELISMNRFVITVEPRLVVSGFSLTITQELSYSETRITNGGILNVEGAFDFGDLLVDGTNSLLSLAATGTVRTANLMRGAIVTSTMQKPLLLVASNLWIDASSRIDVSGKGYAKGAGSSPNGQGPGGGEGAPGGGAGSHGGIGGMSGNGHYALGYGSFLDPAEPGSGGGRGYPTCCFSGDGGSGGGIVRLQIQQLHLNGVIAADGMAGDQGYGGSGAGGSIRIDVGTLTGSGTIRANGGRNPRMSGGGGGRVAVYYQDLSGFTGKTEAKGDSGEVDAQSRFNGGAGTVYLKKASDALGELIIDNGGIPTADWSTVLTNQSGFVLARLSVKGSSRVDVQSSLVTALTVSSGTNNDLRATDGSFLGDLTLSSSNLLSVYGGVSFRSLGLTNGAVLALSGLVRADSVSLRAGSLMTVPPQVPLELTVSNSFWIDASSRIDVSGKGYAGGAGSSPNGQGPGGGVGSPGGGAGSYGGIGGMSGDGHYAPAYGSFLDPTELGSGGGRGYPVGGFSSEGGSGGGIMRLDVQRLHLDGVIAVNGMPGGGFYAGCGSGGSIRIDVGVLTGSGTIRANGGTNEQAGGGGGRVAAYYQDLSGFGGRIEAKGGSGYADQQNRFNGGAGTVYLKKASDALGELFIDNGGVATTDGSTPILGQDILWLQAWSISGNARVSTTNSVRVATGDPAAFLNLISNNVLQVRGLFVGDSWVYGDFIDLAITASAGQVRVTMFGEPNKSHVLQSSTDLISWTPIVTNTLIGTSFEFRESEVVPMTKRFYRVLKPNQ